TPNPHKSGSGTGAFGPDSPCQQCWAGTARLFLALKLPLGNQNGAKLRLGRRKYMTHLTNIRNLLSLIDREVDGLEFSSEDRYRISSALFDIVHEHAKGIVILLEQTLFASAYALVRPMFEGFVRAVWLKGVRRESIAHPAFS
ncbi:MAG: hypothetical protein AB1491_06655, partial [Thermodesulfobacteriota bacterium]